LIKNNFSQILNYKKLIQLLINYFYHYKFYSYFIYILY